MAGAGSDVAVVTGADAVVLAADELAVGDEALVGDGALMTEAGAAGTTPPRLVDGLDELVAPSTAAGVPVSGVDAAGVAGNGVTDGGLDTVAGAEDKVVGDAAATAALGGRGGRSRHRVGEGG